MLFIALWNDIRKVLGLRIQITSKLDTFHRFSQGNFKIQCISEAFSPWIPHNFKLMQWRVFFSHSKTPQVILTETRFYPWLSTRYSCQTYLHQVAWRISPSSFCFVCCKGKHLFILTKIGKLLIKIKQQEKSFGFSTKGPTTAPWLIQNIVICQSILLHYVAVQNISVWQCIYFQLFHFDNKSWFILQDDCIEQNQFRIQWPFR